MIQEQIAERLTKFKGLTKDEESALLALNAAQKKIVVANDRKLKNEFLGAAPAINHGTVKNTPKFQAYVAMAKKNNAWIRWLIYLMTHWIKCA